MLVSSSYARAILPLCNLFTSFLSSLQPSSCTVISAAQHEVNEALLASLQAAVDALEGSDAAVGKDYIATAKKVNLL